MRPQGAPEPRDDIDRLFARLQSVTPPANLTPRIMGALPDAVPATSVRVAAAPRRSWSGVAAVAGLVLLLMSLRLGILLDESGALGVLGQIGGDFGDFLSAPGDYLAPLASELPWFDMIIMVAALATFWLSSTATVSSGRQRQTR